MKLLPILLIFLSFALTLQAQFEPKTKALGGNFFLNVNNPNRDYLGYNFSGSISPTFSHWQNSRWSHHFSLGYGYSQGVVSNGASTQSPNFAKMSYQSHNYLTSYGLRRWFNLYKNKLFAYPQFQIGGGYSQSSQVNSGNMRPRGTFSPNFRSVNIGANAGLMYRFSNKFALDVQASLLNYSINHSSATGIYYHGFQSKPLNAGFQVGLYYFLGNK